MIILALDTSSRAGSVALTRDGAVVATVSGDPARTHGDRLPGDILRLLADEGLSLAQVDLYAVSSGPGSYTGLRIGMSLARGLAAAGEIPIIPVPTLFAMNTTIQQKGIYWLMLHSHKNLVYAQRYHSGEPDSEILFEEYQAEKHAPVYGYNLENLCEDYESIPPSAKSVGELALQNYDQWVEVDINKVSPNYVTNFNVGKVKRA